MPNRVKYIFIAIVLFTFSCSKVKNKGKEVAHNAKEKVKSEVEQQINKAISKVFPPFDSDEPDTENNKQRFKEFLQIELTEDIHTIYCFDDAIGIDADFMFSFHCNKATSQRIIDKHLLTIDTENRDNAFGLQHDFDWWDKPRISQLQTYIWTNDNRFYKYFWFDEENEKAYYFVFDM